MMVLFFVCMSPEVKLLQKLSQSLEQIAEPI